jgi:hypothetical protein
MVTGRYFPSSDLRELAWLLVPGASLPPWWEFQRWYRERKKGA